MTAFRIERIEMHTRFLKFLRLWYDYPTLKVFAATRLLNFLSVSQDSQDDLRLSF